MKKGLIFVFGLLSFLGLSTVKADTINNYYLYSDFNDNYYFSSEYTYDFINTEINNLVNLWSDRYKDNYPYYSIYLDHGVSTLSINLIMYNSIPSSYSSFLSLSVSNKEMIYSFEYRFENGNKLSCISGSDCFGDIYWVGKPTDFIGRDLFYLDSESNYLYRPQFYYDSNFDLIYNLEDSYNVFKNDNLLFSINNGEIIPTYSSLIENNYQNNYIEIDLNNYSYIALSLKDYNTIPESNSSTYTNIYVKGQLCITPVYNYGMTERKDILTGTQVQGCSLYYDDFALNRLYILKDDVENHAIYYLKPYDTSKSNSVKIDTSIFNISYISEENKNNPEVNINGKIYPTLSYDTLTDTATKSEEEGYISGVSCAVGDFNCYNEYNPDNIFKDLFDKPLDILKTVWTAITSIFLLIAEFIALLPPTMQGFLYFAFGISIVLGIIKILL